MMSLLEVIKEAEERKVAVGHFNISDLAALRAIFEAARELDVPVIIGTSDGEAEFVGRYQAAALVKSLRERYNFPIFLNSDHTHKMEGVREAAEAGYDSIIFDASKLGFEENISSTKEAVSEIKTINSDILIEGELGYIGSSSKMLDELPEGAAINSEDLSKPSDAARFVKETGVDMLAPAVGNLHGMFKGASNPDLDIERIKAIKEATGAPLVLHGGSGIKDNDFVKAIEAGINIVHINTEIRAAWREGLEKSLEEKPDEITPYKILPGAVEAVKKVVIERLRLFNKM